MYDFRGEKYELDCESCIGYVKNLLSAGSFNIVNRTSNIVHLPAYEMVEFGEMKMQD